MKGVIKKVLIFMFVFFTLSSTVNATPITLSDAISAVDSAEVSVNSYTSNFNNWVSNNKNAVLYLTTNEVATNITNNHETRINYMINKLTSGGFLSAANSLSSIKTSLVNDLNNIDSKRQIVYQYLKQEEQYGISGNLDIINRLENYFRNIDNNTGKLLNSIYNIYYNDLSNKIDNNISPDNFINEVNKDIKFSTAILDAFSDDISDWQDLYNSYVDSTYEDRIKTSSIYQKYTTKIDNAYNNLYNKGYTSFRNRLENKVNSIDNESGITIENHNNKLYELINKLKDLKTEFKNDFTDLNSYVKIALIKNNITKKQNEILNQMDQEIAYVESHLWNDNKSIIYVGKTSDEKYFDIDLTKNILVYKSDILASNSFMSKLKTDYTKLEMANIYNGMVGTDSVIKIYNNTTLIEQLKVAVIADVYPDGKISALDYVAIKNHIMDAKKITSETSKLAADCNQDSKISALDYIYIKNYIMNR